MEEIEKFKEKIVNSKNYEDFISIFINNFYLNKMNKDCIQKINFFEFFGRFTVLVSQFDLFVFNFFLDNNQLSENFYKDINYNGRISFLSQEWEMTKDDNETILKSKSWHHTDKKFYLTRFLSYLNLNERQEKSCFNKLKNGYWNYYVTHILNKEEQFKWFKEIKSYRNQIVHDVDNYEHDNPFTSTCSHNTFKTNDIVFDIEKFLELIWKMICFLKNQNIKLNFLNFHLKFLFLYKSIIGFIIIYNRLALSSEKNIPKYKGRIQIGDLFLLEKDSDFIPIGINQYKFIYGKENYKDKKERFLNDSNLSFSYPLINKNVIKKVIQYYNVDPYILINMKLIVSVISFVYKRNNNKIIVHFDKKNLETLEDDFDCNMYDFLKYLLPDDYKNQKKIFILIKS